MKERPITILAAVIIYVGNALWAWIATFLYLVGEVTPAQLAIGMGTLSAFTLLSAFLAFMAFRRANWARYAIAAMSAYELYSSLSGLSDFSNYPSMWLVQYALAVALTVSAVVLLFLPQSNRWYKNEQQGI